MSSDGGMSDEALDTDAIRWRADNWLPEQLFPGLLAGDVMRLLAEVERLRAELVASDRLGEYVAGSASRTLDLVNELRAENAALREFIQIVADNSYASERDLVESARALLEGSEG